MNTTAPTTADAAVALTVAALTIDCAQPAVLAEFWGRVLGRPVGPEPTAGLATVEATGPESGPRLFLQRVPEPKAAKNRVHLDLVTEQYDAEIERLTGLGARRLDEIKHPGVRWTTFADPEGNEFDLLTFESE